MRGSGERVSWAPNWHTLSYLHKIWGTYGPNGAPSCLRFFLKTATRWPRNRRFVLREREPAGEKSSVILDVQHGGVGGFLKASLVSGIDNPCIS